MALRYSYGPHGWGLDPKGCFRTPQEIGRWFGYQEQGYDPLLFSRYETPNAKLNWTPGSLETSIRYAKDPFGNYYMDPNGPYQSMHISDRKACAIRSVHVPNVDEFRMPE